VNCLFNSFLIASSILSFGSTFLAAGIVISPICVFGGTIGNIDVSLLFNFGSVGCNFLSSFSILACIFAINNFLLIVLRLEVVEDILALAFIPDNCL
jgi:hypothetical protein